MAVINPNPFTTRPEIDGTFGVVASTHWIGTAVGMSILERGGNAFDAGIATIFTLQVVEPHLCGPGGDVPAILYDAKAGGEPIVVYESIATIRFIDDMHPEPPLMPPVANSNARPVEPVIGGTQIHRHALRVSRRRPAGRRSWICPSARGCRRRTPDIASPCHRETGCCS